MKITTTTTTTTTESTIDHDLDNLDSSPEASIKKEQVEPHSSNSSSGPLTSNGDHRVNHAIKKPLPLSLFSIKRYS